MILGIESSCDESALALFAPETGLVGEWTHRQIDLHKLYGGVVPDLASREHLEQFMPLLDTLLGDPHAGKVSKIAVTCGPGLASALAMGMALGKALSLAWDVPVVGCNHLKGHALSPFIPVHANDPENFLTSLKDALPHLGLIVSGGNTLLFRIEENLSIKLLAQTVDDAAGEALDKGAKLLGMHYPGGPLIEKQAQGGNPKAFEFPRAMTQKSDKRFSFSGLKTSLRYMLEKLSDEELKNQMPDLCASYQAAVLEQLLNKTRHILEGESVKSIGLSGGVANNKSLRSGFTELAQAYKLPLLIANPTHSGDNAGMIAFAAYMDPKGTFNNEGMGLTLDPSLSLA